MADGKERDRRVSNRVRDFILGNLKSHPKDIASFTSSQLKISRQAVNRHLRKLIKENLVSASGKTKGREYILIPKVNQGFGFKINEDLDEDKIWREKIRPNLTEIRENVLEILQYGFTEMVNNAIEHSEGKKLGTNIKVEVDLITLMVYDDGVGIFNKIQKELGLSDPREAILELAKGKLTTDPDHHTGEGIFFASRMFNKFAIMSDKYFFQHELDGDWILETTSKTEGTVVSMEISADATQTIRGVFDSFSTREGSFAFSKTRFPVFLAKFGDEKLLSRSQARRVLARVDQFDEVWLDFYGIESIGQGFADEIFRVFRKEHPEIKIVPTRANDNVKSMIERVISGGEERQYKLPMN